MGPVHPLALTDSLHFQNSEPLLPALNILNVDGSVGLKRLLCRWPFLLHSVE